MERILEMVMVKIRYMMATVSQISKDLKLVAMIS
jgi:hypothetical protein